MKKLFSFRCKNTQTKKHIHFSLIAKDIFEAYKIIENKHKNIIVLEFLGSSDIIQKPTKKNI